VDSVKGDFHCHTSYNGGEHTIEEMAEEAIKMGHSYLGITDHSKSLRIENGLDEKRLLEQKKEIDKLNKKYNNFRLLSGVEVNILKDGSLDISDDVLKVLDYVSISIHSRLKMTEEDMTKRILKAMDNPYVKTLNHPTGMILGKREGYKVDMEAIIKKLKKEILPRN
jgi:DNA polymerase (family 10)